MLRLSAGCSILQPLGLRLSLALAGRIGMTPTIPSAKQFPKNFDAILAPYATKHSESNGRRYPEAEHTYRLPYQRDRDRIVHANAFRRLKHKTQVFVADYGDHYRTRLTHTLEAAQISRSIARTLRLNEDLAEAIALAHDLGHTPFGHSGEQVMDALLKEHGDRFEHNAQSRRVVELLERRYPSFPGLNLTWETLWGLAKHETPWDHPLLTGQPLRSTSLEGQVVNFGDEIAYTAHDIDDGLRAGMFTVEALLAVPFIRDIHEVLVDRFPNMDPQSDLYRYQLIRDVIDHLATDITRDALHAIARTKIKTVNDVYERRKPLINFSKEQAQKNRALRTFLHTHFYENKKVIAAKREGQWMIERLFRALMKRPKLLPPDFQSRIDHPDPLYIVVKDYIAGMTDHFAREEYKRIV